MNLVGLFLMSGYIEMVEFAFAFSEYDENDLNIDERNVVSVAFKNVISSRRAAWRVIDSIERKESKKENKCKCESRF